MRRSSLLATGFVLLLSLPALAEDRPMRIVSEGGIDKDWAPAAPLVMPPYPAKIDPRPDLCVTIGYQVGRDGSTSQLSLLRVWSSASEDPRAEDPQVKPFVQSAAAVVSMWKYQAKPDASANRVVYTAASIPFSAGTTPPAEVGAHCRIEDLKSFIADARNGARKRGDLSNEEYERAYRNFSPAADAAKARANRNSRGL